MLSNMEGEALVDLPWKSNPAEDDFMGAGNSWYAAERGCSVEAILESTGQEVV